VRSSGYYYYNDDTGAYAFWVWHRRLYDTTAIPTIGANVTTAIAQAGSSSIHTFHLPADAPLGSLVDIVRKRSVNTDLLIRVGVFVDVSAPNTSMLPCRCHLPHGLQAGTPGESCGLHSISQVKP
jgi:hypothetical protein